MKHKINFNTGWKHMLVLVFSAFFSLSVAHAQSFGVMTPNKPESLASDGTAPCYRERDCDPEKKRARDNNQGNNNYRGESYYWGWGYPSNRPQGSHGPNRPNKPHKPHTGNGGDYGNPAEKPRTDFRRLTPNK